MRRDPILLLVLVGVAAGCSSLTTTNPTVDPPTRADIEESPIEESPSYEAADLEVASDPGPTREELASALYEAQLYSSATWLYGRLLEEGDLDTSEMDEVLFRRAVSLLSSGGALGAERARVTAGDHLKRLVESFPDSVHRAAASSLLSLIEALRGAQDDLAKTRRQLDAVREIDLEKPPR